MFNETQLAVLFIGIPIVLLITLFIFIVKYYDITKFIQWYDFKQKRIVKYNKEKPYIKITPWFQIRIEAQRLRKITYNILFIANIIASILIVILLLIY